MDNKLYFDYKSIEPYYYKIWESRGYFEIGNDNKDLFCIMMPPPNVTGKLHIGHAFGYTLQDTIVRFKRMDGFRVLWQPGVDHAGIATQSVVERNLLSCNIKKEDIGKEKFLEEVLKWTDKSHKDISSQLRRLGISAAWSRDRFTMDDSFQRAVKKAFAKLYEDGVIFRDTYMINWCIKHGAISDIEVEHKKQQGSLYYLKYKLYNSSDFLVIATTRPETYFADTAVMVNPKDKRYTKLIGKFIELPIIGRKIPIIGDSNVDMDFGTGAVKVTPGHDMNDYEASKRHNLETLICFNEDGVLNSLSGEFQGKDRLKAREAIVNKLHKEGFIDKILDYENQVGCCYRCGSIIEPYISNQWFIKKEIALAVARKLDENCVEFYPKHWINSLKAWVKDIKNWCISRQLWWGHQIPLFYCKKCDYEGVFYTTLPDKCPRCLSKDIYQDPNVLDTWFSSALWPFATLGWHNGESLKGKKWFSGDLEDFYPNTLLITGFDILFFWAARMMFFGEYFLKQLPFKKLHLHAIIRDEFGNKMSKSKGNVINPIDILDQFGCDILRFSLSMLAVQGRDVRFSMSKILQIRNFTNKLYNASKFFKMHFSSFEDLNTINISTDVGLYINSRLCYTTKAVRDALDEYRFNDAATVLYRFFWGEICDFGIELSKINKNITRELGSIYKEALKLLHPIMPFITEYLYQELSDKKIEDGNSIMLSAYPKDTKQNIQIEKLFSIIKESVVSIRRAKANINMENKTLKEVFILLNDKKIDINNLSTKYISFLSKVQNIKFITNSNINFKYIKDISDNLEVFLPIDGIDLTSIVNRLRQQENKIEANINKLDLMLKNKNFIKNAPKNIVDKNILNLDRLKLNLAKVREELNFILRK